MRFAPQRRANFWHRNVQKWSKGAVFGKLWLANVLRATAAYNFSCLLWPHGSAPAALASLLFDPADPQIIAKTQHSVIFITFLARVSSFFSLSRNYIFFLLTLLLFSIVHLRTLLFCSAFHFSILSEVWLPNFFSLLNKDIMSEEIS